MTQTNPHHMGKGPMHSEGSDPSDADKPEEPGMNQEIAEIYRKETDASCKDNLTGLFTHGFFHLLLENEIHRSRRYGSSFTIGLIGIDGFGKYNQQNGSLKGDRILQDFARLIRHNVRKVDIAARYGGDVFAILFPETGPDRAGPAIARILSQIEESTDQALTASAGIASFPAEAETKSRLLSKTNEALREAKNEGRNRSFCFIADDPAPDEIETADPLVLVVDDEPLNRKLMTHMLTGKDYRVLEACDDAEALEMVQGNDIDLIFMDVMMPEMDGFEACPRIKTSPDTRMIPVVLLTALDDVDSKVRGFEVGADEFITKPPNKLEILARAASLVKVKRLNDNLTNVEKVLVALANAVEIKDHYTQGHIQRVSDLAAAMGRRMGMSQFRINALRFGGILHDIGKISIPETILKKKGRLTDEEWKVMKTHTEMETRSVFPSKKP